MSWVNPCDREGPVPVDAVRDLLDAMPYRPSWLEDLIDIDVAAREARRFKFDVSFSLAPGEPGRLSVNDKGEAEAFRDRLRRLFPGRWLEAFLAISPPGEVQTTAGIKVGPRGLDRLTVYYEELGERSASIAGQILGLAGVDAAPLDGCVAVSLDVDARGELVCAKDYGIVLDPDDPDYSEVPSHPVTGRRTFLRARRFLPGGPIGGSKLGWLSEVHRAEQVEPAWSQVDRLRTRHGFVSGPAAEALDALRAGWRHGPDTFLYPDAVSVDRNPEGLVKSLVVYTSLK